jgi:predicted nucleic acid-binding protein
VGREQGPVHPTGWKKDTPYVALTLHLDGRLWTEDEELKNALLAKGFDRFLVP